MVIEFLGTAAGEGIPAIFCRCDICNQARARGGKNIRSRTSVIIDGVLKIDMPPDTWHHSATHGLDLCGVRDLFFTHSHGDHLDASAVEARLPWFSHGCDAPLNVYANETVLRDIRERTCAFPDLVRRRLIRAWEPVRAETATITPLLADHAPEETCLMLWIERNGKTFFYGHDSGYFPDATWAWLAGRRADGVVLECTTGRDPCRRGHLGLEAHLEVRQRLREMGVIDDRTKSVASHFSHNGRVLHEDLEAFFAPHGVIVAHDGMVLDIS